MTQYISEGLLIDVQMRHARFQQNVIEMSPITFDLLVFLVSNAPETQSFDQIIAEVWSQQIVADETVTQRIALLRKSLKQCGVAPSCIESMRNKGYRWTLPVESVANQVAIDNPQNPKRNWLKLSIASMVLCALVILLLLNNHTENAPSSTFQADTNTASLVAQAYRYQRKFDNKNNEIAIEMFHKALAQQPDNLDALVGLSVSLAHKRSKYQGELANIQQALETAKHAKTLYPESAEAIQALAFVYDVKGNIPKAVDYYRQALLLKPKNKTIRADLAYLLSIQGKLTEALKLNVQAFAGQQQYKYLQIAQILAWLGLVDKAESWFKQSVKFYPDDVYSTPSYAQFLIARDRLEDAQTLLSSSEQYQRDNYLYSNCKAILLFLRGNLSESKAVFELSLTQRQEQITAHLWLKLIAAKQQPLTEYSHPHLQVSHYNLDELWPAQFVELAMLEALNHHPDKALELLNTAVKNGFSDEAWLKFLAETFGINDHKTLLAMIDTIRTKNRKQLIQVSQADWLPDGLID